MSKLTPKKKVAGNVIGGNANPYADPGRRSERNNPHADPNRRTAVTMFEEKEDVGVSKKKNPYAGLSRTSVDNAKEFREQTAAGVKSTKSAGNNGDHKHTLDPDSFIIGQQFDYKNYWTASAIKKWLITTLLEKSEAGFRFTCKPMHFSPKKVVVEKFRLPLADKSYDGAEISTGDENKSRTIKVKAEQNSASDNSADCSEAKKPTSSDSSSEKNQESRLKRKRVYNPECDERLRDLNEEEKELVRELARTDGDDDVLHYFQRLVSDPTMFNDKSRHEKFISSFSSIRKAAATKADKSDEIRGERRLKNIEVPDFNSCFVE